MSTLHLQEAFMAKIGRNDPCPCGSGKKYKRCCLKLHQATRPTEDPVPLGVVEYDDLDDLSNRAVDLVRAGDLDEAEKVARELLRRYPDQVDGIERLAMVHEARGDREKAAEWYRKATHFAESHEGFDPEVAEDFRQQAEQLAPTQTPGAAEEGDAEGDGPTS
jgi:tetratricopeptide (TPR) repeat protein